jgi:hypothetical protein
LIDKRHQQNPSGDRNCKHTFPCAHCLYSGGSSLNAKRTYLSLLPPFQLIDLLLAIDADRSNVSLPIFPPNLDDAIKHLQAARQAYPSLYSHPYYVQPPPIPAKPGTASNAPSAKRLPASSSEVKKEPVQSEHVVQPPNKPTQSHSNSNSSLSHQQPLFASGPVARHSGSAEPRVHEDMPSYEEMIAEAIAEMNDPEGTAPKVLFAWMAAYVSISYQLDVCAVLLTYCVSLGATHCKATSDHQRHKRSRRLSAEGEC